MARWAWKLALIALFFSPSLYAQGNVAFNWTHSWGGTGTESGSAVATDSSGNVFVAGSTTSFGAGNQDVLLLKYDSAGVPQWERTWGGASNDFANGVITDANGFVYVVGGTESFGAGWFDVLLLKFDEAGNLIWERTWGGSSFDVGYDISFDKNGNLAIAAESYSFGNSAVLLTFSTDGTLLGERAWKGPATYDSAYSVTVDGSGNQILTGISWDYSIYPNHNTIFILKYDSQGNFLWSRDWAGPSEDEANGRKTVRTDAQGNIYIAGRTSESCTNANFSLCDFNVLLLKMDPNGNLLWAKKWGGTGWDTANALSLDSNGNPVVVGSTRSFFGGLSAALIQEYNTTGGGPTVSKVLATSAASDWYGLVAGTSGTFVSTGDGPNNGGKWQDTGISAVSASGSLSTPSYSVYTPSGIIGTPSGTVTDPRDLGVTDSGAGGADTLTSIFTLSAVANTGTINVTTNLGAATFTIFGPKTFSGAGTSFTQTDAPEGTYTIIYNPVAGYQTPDSEAMTLLAGSTISFSGKYRPSLLLSPTSLSFAYHQGDTNPVPIQTVNVSSSGFPLTFTASSSTTNAVNWLSVSPSTGTTTASLSVSAASGLSSGTYSGLITISSQDASNSPQTVAVTLTVGATLPVLPAPGSFSTDEMAFRQVLSGEAKNFPVRQNPQSITGGNQALWSGLQSVLGTECAQGQTLNYIFLDTDALDAVCAGSHIATGQFLSSAFLSLAEQFINNGLDLFAPTTLGGEILLSGTKVFVSTVGQPNPNNQVIISASEQLLAPMLGRLVGAYLSEPVASFTANTISQKLSEDQVSLGKATANVQDYQQQDVTATVAWAYNPFTHYIVAFISTSEAPGIFYAVYYEVGQHGLISSPSTGPPTHEVIFRCQASCTQLN